MAKTLRTSKPVYKEPGYSVNLNNVKSIKSLQTNKSKYNLRPAKCESNAIP